MAAKEARLLLRSWNLRLLTCLIFLLLMVNYQCSAPSCKASASSQSALHKHQGTCSAYRQFLETITPAPSSELTDGPILLRARHRVPPGPTKKISTLAVRKARNPIEVRECLYLSLPTLTSLSQIIRVLRARRLLRILRLPMMLSCPWARCVTTSIDFPALKHLF